MPTFYENDPSLQSYWRSIILYGRNVASYKFALAKSLIDLKSKQNDLIKLEDLSVPFSRHLCEHLKHNDKQITSPSSPFLETCKKYNQKKISEDELIQTTKKKGFINVIDAFHKVNGSDIPNRFFIDERLENEGIRITDKFYELYELKESENFLYEVESRWRLVETAWKLGISSSLLEVHYDQDKEIFFTGSSDGRIDVTSSRPALNGYQKGKCFYCYDYISVIKKSEFLAHVDHFFPHTLKSKIFKYYIDGLWNLVLSCQSCNNGTNGKFAKLPTLKLLNRLHKRNEYFASSHLPLSETIRIQTGSTSESRHRYLQGAYLAAKDILIHNWEPDPKGIDTFQ
jgi:5-methylcytosine-specific restriction endonuclease McrA